jgi:methionyl-tRNA formyltransferase
VADRERVAIAPHDTALDVEAKLAAASVTLLARALPQLTAGTLAFAEQDHADATFCRRLTKDDGALDFSVPAAVLAARINGLFPWPACATEVAGLPIKLGLADTTAEVADIVAPVVDRGTGEGANQAGNPANAGTVLGADGAGLLVATGAGVLRVRRLQRPGGKMLPAAEFLRGFAVAAGTVLPSRPMPVLVAKEPFRHR